LKCEDGTVIRSLEGPFGAYWVSLDRLRYGFQKSLITNIDESWWMCNGDDWFVGFKIFSMEDNGGDDDYGALNIGPYCEKPEGGHYLLGPADGVWGQLHDEYPGTEGYARWSSKSTCSSGKHVCGFQTRVEKSQGGTLISLNVLDGFSTGVQNDDTAFTDMKMKCCESTVVTYTKSEDINCVRNSEYEGLIELTSIKGLDACKLRCGNLLNCFGFTYRKRRGGSVYPVCYMFTSDHATRENYLFYMHQADNDFFDWYLKDEQGTL